MAEQQTNVEELGEDLDKEGNPNPPKGIDPAVLATAEKAGAAKLYAQIMQDPEVGAVLRARAAQKKIKVVEDDGRPQAAPKENEEETAPDLENMNETQKMQYLVKQMGKQIESTVDKKIAPLNQQLSELSGFATDLRKKDARGEVETLAKEFKDFKTHAPRMSELAGEHPTLSARQLYMLAAQEAGVLSRSERGTTSERPSNSTARPAGTQRKAGPNVGPGFGGLSDLIAQAAAKATKANIQTYGNEE